MLAIDGGCFTHVSCGARPLQISYNAYIEFKENNGFNTIISLIESTCIKTQLCTNEY